MAMNVLMVGMSRTWAEVLDNADERYHLYVVEEPDPWNNRKLGEVKLSNIREVQLLISAQTSKSRILAA
jgi:hypothetical protein